MAEELKEQISESLKKYYEEHPEALEKISEDQKKRFENPEEHIKVSEGLKNITQNTSMRL